MKIAMLSLALAALAPAASAQSSLPDSNPQGLHDLFGLVLTAASQPAIGNEPFSATAAGATLLADLNPGPAHAFEDGDPEVGLPTPLRGAIMGADLYFFAYLANGNIGLSRTDGSPVGTAILHEFPQYGSGTIKYGYPFEGVGLTDRVVFAALQPTGAWGLYGTDGTGAAPQLLATTQFRGLDFTRLGNAALFFDLGTNMQVKRTDGTPAGTGVVYTFPPGSSLDYDSFAVVGDEVFFAANNGTEGMELWRTDGTPAGTNLVLDISTGTADSDPADLVAVGEELYFSADDGAGRALWRSDGTAAGTSLVAKIQWGYSEGPRHLTALGERLFFAHGVSGSKDRLFVFDPASASLDMLHEFKGPSGHLEGIREITAIGSRRVFVQGNEGFMGFELWVSDGTVAGTQLFEDVQPGSGWGLPKEFLLSNGMLFFTAIAVPGVEALHHRAIGATAHSLGVGCSASGHLPKLAADDPVLGGTSQIRVRGAEASASVFVFAGPKAAPTDLGFGCIAHLDLTSMSLVATGTTDASGAWSSAPISVSSDPALDGAQLMLQAVVGPTGTQPQGFDVSSAVLLTFGN